MNDEEFEAKVKALSFWSGKNSMTIEDLATVQPGLARLMPEVGARTWKLFYAAKLENWPMAKFQYKEIIGLLELGAFMRPKHADALNQFIEENPHFMRTPGPSFPDSRKLTPACSKAPISNR